MKIKTIPSLSDEVSLTKWSLITQSQNGLISVSQL